MELMHGKLTHTHNGCIGTLLCRINDFPFSKKIQFKYEDKEGVKKHLVAHFYVDDGAFAFIVAFANED